jgi:hypothetical protein
MAQIELTVKRRKGTEGNKNWTMICSVNRRRSPKTGSTFVTREAKCYLTWDADFKWFESEDPLKPQLALASTGMSQMCMEMPNGLTYQYMANILTY